MLRNDEDDNDEGLLYINCANDLETFFSVDFFFPFYFFSLSFVHFSEAVMV